MTTALAQLAYCTAVPWPPSVASRMVLSISGAASVSRPRRAARTSAPYGATRVRVASVAAWASSMRRAALAGELHLARRGGQAGVEVPHEDRRRRRQPAPPQDLLDRCLAAGERGGRALQDRRRGRASLGEHERETVEEQVRGQRPVRR